MNIGASGANGQSGIFYAPTLFYKIGIVANDTTTPITFVNNNGTERMRIDSSGNVGIGTASPAFKLHTYIASGTAMFKFESGANTGIYGYWTRPNQSYIQALNLDNNGDKDFSLYDATNSQVADRYYPSSSGYRAFFTNGSERVRIDSSGNVGIGVTPSAWGSAWKGFQVQQYTVAALGSDEADINLNAYNDNSGWRYISTNFATQYRQGSGIHIWYTAPSGTAGNSITFTERMRIDTTQVKATVPFIGNSGTKGFGGITTTTSTSTPTGGSSGDHYYIY